MRTTKESVKLAIEIAGSQANLAQKLGVTRQMVSRWALTGKISIHHYLTINQFIHYNEIKKYKNS